MARFTKRKNNIVPRTVPVVFGTESLGDLDIEVEIIPQAEYERLMEDSDHELVKRILKKVGDIQDEATEEMITGDAAIELVLNDICCVSAVAGDYLEASKAANFRKSGSRARR